MFLYFKYRTQNQQVSVLVDSKTLSLISIHLYSVVLEIKQNWKEQLTAAKT